MKGDNASSKSAPAGLEKKLLGDLTIEVQIEDDQYNKDLTPGAISKQIDAGVRQTNRRTIEASVPNPAGEMVLDLRVGMGQIDVRLVAAGN